MIAGHFFLAFSIVSLAAYIRGYESRKALSLGFLAGLFAFIPDVDILYAFKELVEITSGFWNFKDSFWNASTETHRGITHSLVISVFAAGSFAAYHKTGRKTVAITAVALMAIAGFYLSGLIPAVLVGVFMTLGFMITEKATETTNLREVLAVCLAGLLSHPFGDVFTGVPPDFLYPFKFQLISERVVLLKDPSLNFLAVFGLELTLMWSAMFTYIYVSDRNFREDFSLLPATGFLYGLSSFFITSPTISQSYTFVFSILGFSILVTSAIWFLADSRDRKTFYAFFDFLTVHLYGYLAYLLLFVLS